MIVYGIISKKTKKVLYVGQTLGLRFRLKHHFHSTKSPFFDPEAKRFSYNVLYRAKGLKDLSKKESDLIKYYKARGQCKYNTTINIISRSTKLPDVGIYVKGLRREFRSAIAAASFFKASPQTVLAIASAKDSILKGDRSYKLNIVYRNKSQKKHEHKDYKKVFLDEQIHGCPVCGSVKKRKTK